MADRQSFDEFRMPQEMWEQLEPLLPEYAPSPEGGRPRNNLRDVADGIFYCLRTGCHWKAIPPHICPGSTCHDYFQEWRELGIFEALWEVALEHYEDVKGLDLEWQSIDGAMNKAPLGGEDTGPNPTDRGKSGTKRSLQTDAAGIPIGLATSGANVHDKRLVEPTFEHKERMIPEGCDCEEEHVCADKGYDYPDTEELMEVHGYIAHIRSRGEEAHELEVGKKARRWVVERTHGWLNRFRRLLIRWEKKTENFFGLLELACAYFTFRRAEVFG
jgi:putative transposase